MEVQERRPVRATLYDQLLSLELPPSSGPKLTTSSSSPCLGDLLKFRHEEEDPQQLQQQPARGRRSARSVSLGTFLACEKRELPSRGIPTVVASTAAVPDGTGSGRTLLDIIRDEDDQESRGSGGGGGVFEDALVGCANNRHRISWRRAFKQRLRIRRSGNPVDGGVSEEGTVLASPAAPSLPGIPVQDDRPVRAGAGDAAQPTGPSAPVGASSDLATRDGTAGDPAQQRTGRSCGPPAPAAGTAEEGRQQQVQQPVRVSLMTLLDQTDTFRRGGAGFAVPAPLEEDQDQEQDQDQERGKKKKKMYNAGKCCVCMVRHRGAAFIPCGHTFCRLCCRELWVSRGSCPLCNRLILEVLDIF